MAGRGNICACFKGNIYACSFIKFVHMCLAHFILVFSFFLYFDHFSCVIFYTMCSVCLLFLSCLALQDKQKITQYFSIFVTSLTEMKNIKWNEINNNLHSKLNNDWSRYGLGGHPKNFDVCCFHTKFDPNALHVKINKKLVQSSIEYYHTKFCPKFWQNLVS